MSTLPGQASKGEKTKSKFQSLDINNLYRVSRGENLEKQQQKSANVYVRHGMQSLGKVPSARRAPVNLPSLKAEHSGSDAAIPLVPPGAQGWGKQDSNTSQQPNTPTSHTPPQNSTAPSSNANQQNTQQISPHQAAIALPVTTTIPPHPHKPLTPAAQPVPSDKLWSSVMTGQEVPHPPLYQSPQFQHEFPSLSAGDGVPTRTGSDAPQYPSGLSLRPQTEGSWTQGGQRSVGAQGFPGAENSGSGRPAPAHQGSPPQLSAQVGQQQHFPPQIRGVMPSFMCKGSNFQQGPGTGNQNPPTLPTSVNGRGGRPLDNRPPRLAERDGEEVAPRPIIKEEELSRMDEISKDMGWAESDEIDYNQKLAFSDDEGERSTKRDTRRHQQHRGQREECSVSHNIDNQRQWSSSRSNTSRGRSSEEEDIWTQRRSQTDKEVEIAVQRAKQRKEEEEKRFSEERSQAAAKKLSELNERIQKRDRDNQEGIGTINPNTVPPKPINHVDIPIPDFQKDKERDNKDPPRERDNRSRTPNDTVEDKNQSVPQGSSFRQLTQIEGKNFPNRKHMKPSDREPRDNREQNGPSFSKHFKEDLPPRFLKHQRNNSNSNLQTHQQQPQQQQQPHQQLSHQQQQQPHQQLSHQQQQQPHQQLSHQQQQQQYHHQSFDNRWSSNNQNNLKHQSNSSQNLVHNRSARQDSLEVEREEDQKEYRRQSSEDSFRSSYHSQDNTPKPVQETAYQEEGRENRHHEQQFNRREQEENSWHKEVEKLDNKRQDHSTRLSNEDWGEKKEKMRDENPDRYERDRQQRPENRDIRSARHSRESEPRDYMGSWSESAYEPSYEEKRRDHIREDRRAVPGPITKERIEADDMRNEKRNLTQLKRGQPVEVKSEIKKYEKEEEQKKERQFISAWADSIPPPSEEIQNKVVEEKKSVDTHKSVTKSSVEQPKKQEKSDDHSTNRNRSYGQKKGWGNVPNDYHTSRGQPWQRRPSSRGQKHGGKSTESYMTTDSDGSAEDHSVQQKLEGQKIETNDQKNLNIPRKVEKDDKNRENRQEKFVGEQKKQEKSDKRDSNYVPRGEPSRHGRGGGNFRSGRMGMGKRIDGYGPPPAKSPFGGHQEEKDKKVSSDEANSSENLTFVEDKTKQNQQALAAGIIGKRPESVQSIDTDKSKSKSKIDIQKNKPKMGEKVFDTTENSDEKNKDNRKMQVKMQGNRSTSNVNRGGRSSAPATRSGADRRFDSNRNDNIRHESGRNDNTRQDTNRNDAARSDTRHDTTRTDSRHETPRTDSMRQNSNGSLKKDDKPNDHNTLTNVIFDIAAKSRDGDQVEEKEDKTSVNGDSEGFQEVKSKKTVKERQKSGDAPKAIPKNDTVKEMVKPERERKNKISPATQILTQQQIQSIPSLMATPVNPPPILPQTKNQFDRSRQIKLPPRFAKQKLQKQAMQHQQQQQQHHHGMCDMNDINKVSQNINVYGLKDTSAPPPPVPTCAWDKPLGPQLRNLEHDSMLAVSMEGVKGLEPTHSPSHGISPSSDKMMNKVGSLQDKTLLDGTTPPVNTIIFENTNYKSAPGARGARNDKPRSKLDEGTIDNSVISGFNKPTMNELLQGKSDKSDPIQLPLFKEDTADMKLDFFSADLQFADDKASKNFVSKSIHAITSGNNTVDSLDYKIASVKKVWETSEQEGEDNQINFVPSQLDSNMFSQGKDPSDENHEGYSPSPNQTASTTTNVCKVSVTGKGILIPTQLSFSSQVKPTQQVSGSGQTVLSSSGHQQHAGIIAPGLMGNPLSPPPIPPILGTGVGIGPQYTTNQHIGYQTGLTGNTQFGISAIPSPPTVPLVYNSSQPQIQAAAAQSGLYGAFQLDQLSGQARSQFPQYTNYHGLGQTANSPYSTQNVYLPTAPPHPPPTAQAPPEIYQNMNSYRLSAGAQFGQNQQLSNPTTVLISSTSNSLMSASVKPSGQQISAIGTKAGGVGQAYQPQSQQGQQVFMAYDPSMQANYLTSNAGVIQRGPVAPSQNNVVPALQPSSSYYSGSTGGQSGYFQQPGSSTMPSAQLAQHQSSYGLQGNVFGTHNQSHTNTGMPNYNSHYLTTPMQVAAALNVPQFRSGIPAAFMKSLGSQQVGDPTGRPQQLKSPSSQEVLSSVFNTGPQIPSPKSRQNNKHPPPQSSPTAQHKYNFYQAVGGQQNPNMQRYPTPIQRPVNFQQMQQNISVNQKHRSNPNNKAPNRYYGGQNHSMTGHNDKSDDRKMNDGSGLGSGNSVCTTKSNLGSGTGSAVSAPSDKVKDNIKEETAAKD